MMRTATASALLFCLAPALACGGGRKVLVPPRLELAPYGRVGLATFTVENAKGELEELATRRFAEELLAAQAGFEVLELGEQERLLAEAGADRLDPDAIRAIGAEHGIPALFVGHLVVSGLKPSASLVRYPEVRAEVSVSIAVRLVSTDGGGTLWRSSARAAGTVAALVLTGDVPSFAARDPDEAYGGLVDHLVHQLTHDFRPTYRKL